MAPEIELQQNYTAYDGDNVTITVVVIKAHPPVLPVDISWTYWTAASNESVTITIQSIHDRANISEDGRSLNISDLTSDDEGYYQVLIWHPAGQRNKTTYLRVKEPPTTEGTTVTSIGNLTYLIIGLALTFGLVTAALSIIIIIIVYKYIRNQRQQMMIFEMQDW